MGKIILAPLHFLTETSKNGSLCGYFFQGESPMSLAIRSKEIAYEVLKHLAEEFDLTEEEIRAVNSCIEKSDLPLETSFEEVFEIRIHALKANLNRLSEELKEGFRRDPLEEENESNCPGGTKGDERVGPERLN